VLFEYLKFHWICYVPTCHTQTHTETKICFG